MAFSRQLHFFFSPLLLLLLPCILALEFEVEKGGGTNPVAERFYKEKGEAFAKKIMEEAAEFTWKIFEQDSLYQKKPVQKIKFVIDPPHVPSPSPYYPSGHEIHFSSTFVGDVLEAELFSSLTVSVYELVAKVLQWDTAPTSPGLCQGIARYVSARSHKSGRGWKAIDPTSRWDEGDEGTRTFLVYCSQLRGDFVARLNEKLKDGYKEEYFADLLGKDVKELWKDFLQTEPTTKC